MTPLGWIFMSASLAFVWGLAIWCYQKVLNAPPRSEDDQDGG